MPGRSRYTITCKVAGGGMAEIYLGTQHGDAGFQRPIIIKRIRPAFARHPRFPNMLRDEAHVAMGLLHSNIVQVLDLGRHDGRWFLVMELVDGWDLTSLLRRAHAQGVGFPLSLGLHVVAQVCRALSYAHGQTQGGKPLHIVHRDITPENILVSRQGEVKLADFGIAQAINRQDRTGEGLVRGKLGYLSPEQANGQPVDARSDLYALGCVLYLLATGARPFPGKTDMEVLLRHQEGRYRPLEEVRADLPWPLVHVLRKALQKDPNARYPHAEEMLRDVERVQRTVLLPAGQTELKQWVTALAQRDGAPSTSQRTGPDPEELQYSLDAMLPAGTALLPEEAGPAPRGVRPWLAVPAVAAAAAALWLNWPVQAQAPVVPHPLPVRGPVTVVDSMEMDLDPPLVTAGTLATAPREDRVAVRLYSSPPGAEVRLNGRSVGHTPVLVHVAPGESHQVVFNKDGYADSTRWLVASPSPRAQVVKVTMAPAASQARKQLPRKGR